MHHKNQSPPVTPLPHLLKPLNITHQYQQKQYKLSTRQNEKKIKNLIQSLQYCKQNIVEYQSEIKLVKEKQYRIYREFYQQFYHCFGEFKLAWYGVAENWKKELAAVFKEVMDIITNICIAYQQQIDRLTKISQKPQYPSKAQQKIPTPPKSKKLLKPFQKPPNPPPQPSLRIDPQQIKQATKYQQKIQIKNLIRSYPNPNISQKIQKQSTCIVQCLQRIKQSQISLMQQQITQLFQEEQNNGCQYGEQNVNKINFKIVHNADHDKQCRFKTMNDQKMQKNQIFLTVNALPHKDKDRDIKSSVSQQGSNKSIGDIKQQFWQTMRCSIGGIKSIKSSQKHLNFKKHKQRIKSKSRGSISYKNQDRYQQNNQNYQGCKDVGGKCQGLKKKYFHKDKLGKGIQGNQGKTYQ